MRSPNYLIFDHLWNRVGCALEVVLEAVGYSILLSS